MLGTRSIKTTSKAWAIDLAIAMLDLTTLEGADTPGKVRALCAKAVRPDPSDPTTPSVAAVCVYGDLVPVAVDALARTAARAGSRSPPSPPRSPAVARPCGSSWPTPPTRSPPAPTRSTWSSTAGAFLSGRYLQVFEEIVAVKKPAGSTHLKVILETG